MDFLDYSNIGFKAFEFTEKKQEVVNRKRDITDSVFLHHHLHPATLLFIGFNPAALVYVDREVTVTKVTAECQAAMLRHNPKLNFVDWDVLSEDNSRYDAVVAVDEFLTFADTEDDQHQLLEQICDLAQEVVITTLRDYKNQGFKDREFSVPSVIRNTGSSRLFLEYHDYDLHDRNAWIRSIYQMDEDDCLSWQGFKCRQMFFKQCAKFSIDAGARDFLVHKNLMYKSLMRKNYEHVISMKFGQDGHNSPNRQHSKQSST